MKDVIKRLGRLAKETYHNAAKDKVSLSSAAVAFYTLVSLPPLLALIVTLTSIFLGRAPVREEIVLQAEAVIGQDSARFLETIIMNSQINPNNTFIGIVNFFLLLYGATGIFTVLKRTLAEMWQIKNTKKGVTTLIKNRLVALSAIVLFSLLIVFSLTARVLIGFAKTQLSQIVSLPAFFLEVIDFSFFAVVSFTFFAAAYKLLLGTKVSYALIAIGAVLAAILFSFARLAFSFYLSFVGIQTTFGTAASVIAILILIYLTAQIFFLGAEIIKTYNRFTA